MRMGINRQANADREMIQIFFIIDKMLKALFCFNFKQNLADTELHITTMRDFSCTADTKKKIVILYIFSVVLIHHQKMKTFSATEKNLDKASYAINDHF